MPLAASRILVVEDDTRISDVIEDMICDAGGVVVGPFTSVTDAFEQMGEFGLVNAAVLDIGLIGEDSYALASALKATSVPFGFVTGRERADLPAPFERSAFLSKPFTADQLITSLLKCGVLRR